MSGPHLGPIRPKPGGLAADNIVALLQETPTLVEVPRVTLGRWQARFPPGVTGAGEAGRARRGRGGGQGWAQAQELAFSELTCPKA